MTIISRDIINKNLKLSIYKDSLKSIDYNSVIDLIDRAKTFLLKERFAKIGDKVLICPCDYYIPWLFACAELGMTLIISHSHHPDKEYKAVHDEYGKINHVITSTHIDFEYIVNCYRENIVDADILDTFIDTSCSNIFWATSETVLTLSISETNIKKFDLTTYSHSHAFYYKLLHRNIIILNLNSADRCMHSKILHHGSSLGLFFLPTIKHCESHFWATNNENWHRILIDEQINRCLFMYYDIKIFPATVGKRYYDLSNLTIYTLRSPDKVDVEYIVKKCKGTIVSVYGTTLTSGPVLLQQVTPDNFDRYNNECFGKLLDNHYQLLIKDERLIIRTTDNKIIETQDFFKKIDNIFYFYGANNKRPNQ